MGHARALLSLDSPSMQLKLFREVLRNQYSVRKVEEMVQLLKSGEDVQGAHKRIVAKAKLPEGFDSMKQQLSQRLNAKVQMTYNASGKGKISIAFAGEDELKRIMAAIGLKNK